MLLNNSKRKHRQVHRKLSAEDWKQALLDQVPLAHPNFSGPLLVSVDAGGLTTRPIAFVSKSLSYAQSRYPRHSLEFFHYWLRGHQFTIWTDNNPLTYILSKARLDACEQRWISKLAPFQFEIMNIPGPKNVVADALSWEPFVRPSTLHRLTRVPYEELVAEAAAVCAHGVQEVFRSSAHPTDRTSEDCQPITSQCAAVAKAGTLTSQEVAAVFHAHDLQDSRVCPHARLLPQFSQTVLTPGRLGSEVLSHDVLVEQQRCDNVLSRVIIFVERGLGPSRTERAKEPFEAIKLLKGWQ